MPPTDNIVFNGCDTVGPASRAVEAWLFPHVSAPATGEVRIVWLVKLRQRVLELNVNTFRRDFKLAALGNLNGLSRLIVRPGLGVLDLLDDLVTLKDLAENDVSAIKPAAMII
jgi:hypothetical protein